MAKETWADFARELDWKTETPDHVVTHQVGRAHQRLLFDALGLARDLDRPTVAEHGNTGAAALPTAAALAADAGRFERGDKLAWLGIGSGLNCVMLGWEW